jgi:hypothetical protein
VEADRGEGDKESCPENLSFQENMRKIQTFGEDSAYQEFHPRK